MGLGRRNPEVCQDLWRYFLVVQILGRGCDQPRILVEHEATGNVLAEINRILLGEDEGLLEQLIGVDGALELEEQIRAETLGVKVGWGELRTGADIFGELGVVLSCECGLSDADEILPLAVEMRRAAIRILDREELRAFPEADLFLIVEEVGGGVDHGIRQIEIHISPARSRDAVHVALLEVVRFRQGYPQRQQEDRGE